MDGDVAACSTASNLVDAAASAFGPLDVVINNAGIYFAKPFTEYSTADIMRLTGTNLLGYIYLTQHAITQMLAQNTGGSVIAVSSVMVAHPIAGVTASIPVVTKGGLEAITRNLAMEHVKQGFASTRWLGGS